MGFAPLAVANGTVASSNLVHSTTWSLPSAVMDGDHVYLCLFDNTAAGVPFDTPTGFTLVGVQTLGESGDGWPNMVVALFTKIWHTGDATTSSITHSGGSLNSCEYCSWIVRTDQGSYALNTDTISHGTSASPFTVPAFSPAAQSDLRVLLFFQKAFTGLGTPSTPAQTGENPIPQKMIGLNFGFNGVANETAQMWNSQWRDDAMDGGTGTLTGAAQPWFLRSLDFTDGSDHNGGSSDEVLMFGSDSAVTVRNLDEGELGLSAAAGVFGGGAEIV